MEVKINKISIARFNWVEYYTYFDKQSLFHHLKF